MEDEEHAIVQRDERDSMAAIFSHDFALLCEDPISYSIRLRSDPGAAAESVAVADSEETNESSPRPRPAPGDLALIVTYPPAYPDAAPIIGLMDHGNENQRSSLHSIQERALLGAVESAARADLGAPSAYGCVRAARDFLDGGGLSQAGLTILSDDCLAHVLSYLATSRGAIEAAREALPIFDAASRTNVVWRELCRRRWGGKWGFRKRWKGASERYLSRPDECFWRRAYDDEEEGAVRNVLTRRELSAMTFDYRQWFSFTLFRNQPANMRDVLPTGLRNSLARDVVFAEDGTTQSVRDWLRRLSWKPSNPDTDTIAEVRLWFESNRRSVVGESLTVHRLKNWGWELRGSDYVMRAIDDDDPSDEELWGDLTANIVLEKRPDWVEAHRSPYPYQYREVPDDDDYKILLDW